MRTADFHYDLPEDAIAQEAIEPRDSARLLDTRDLTDHRFSDLPDLLEPGDLLVVNRTRVIPVRLHGHREPTGGQVEVLLLRSLADGEWEAMVRPARRLRAGSRIAFGEVVAVLVTDPSDGIVTLRPEAGTLEQAMQQVGEVPLPPYFHGSLADAERYQTVYADLPGSAAAPTAGLHFTPSVLDALADRGIETTTVELRVGLDTFRPIAADTIADHTIHSEDIVVGPDAVAAVEAARQRGSRVVAVGTTVTRALESAATTDGRITERSGPTDLFITPGYEFKVVDVLITNFHVPASTLVVLVCAFMGEEWRQAYDTALDRGYRFLSFGDSMLAERAP